MDSFDDVLILWNNKFRYDYWYRKKYNIAFNSEEHRAINPIDVKMNYVEENLMEQERMRFVNEQKGEQIYEKTGRWLKKRKRSEAQEEALFDLIDFKGYKPYGKED